HPLANARQLSYLPIRQAVSFGNPSTYPPGMPVKSLITFQNQAVTQFGIDPAFEEAGCGSPGSTGSICLRSVVLRAQGSNKLRICATRKPWNCPGGASEEDRGHHQAIQARRGEGSAPGSWTPGHHRHGSQGLRAPERSRRTLSRRRVHRGLFAQGQNRNHDFDFDLGQKVHDVLGAAIEFGVTFLAPEALGFRDGDALESNFLERFLHLVELEWLDDGLDLLHWRLPGNSMASALRRCATCSILEPVEPPSAGIYCRSNQAIRSRLPQKQGLCQIG